MKRATLPLTGRARRSKIFDWRLHITVEVTLIDLGIPDRIEPEEDKPQGIVQRAIYDYMMICGPKTTAQLAKALRRLWPEGKDLKVIQATINRSMVPRTTSRWFVNIGKTEGESSRYGGPIMVNLWGVKGVHDAGTPMG